MFPFQLWPIVLALTMTAPSYQEMVDDCYPDPRMDRAQFIVGYGSLINNESKNRTHSDTGDNIPVTVTGFNRTWTARGYSNISLSTTYLGVDISPGGIMNGVIFRVPDEEAIESFDDRERLYCRVRIPSKDVTILKGDFSGVDQMSPTENSDLKHAELWVYVTKNALRKLPDETYPIVQSYVDIFLAGCIQVELKYRLTNYSAHCVTWTSGWENPWVNDRLHPRRPMALQNYSAAIDELLALYLPDHFNESYAQKTSEKNVTHRVLTQTTLILVLLILYIPVQ